MENIIETHIARDSRQVCRPIAISSRPLFCPGRIVITPGAKAEIEDRYDGDLRGATLGMLVRHLGGDWSEMSEYDAAANAEATRAGTRVFSMFRMAALPGESQGARIWVITEADRSHTTFLLPDEY